MNLFGNILKTMAVLALFQVLQGCYKDKGNYEYHDANALSINLNCANPYNITRGETISIHPKLNFVSGEGDAERLEYRWYLGSLEGETRDEWNTLDFEWTPDELIDKKTLLLVVTDPVTDIQTFAGITVNVKAVYDAYGVLVLSEKENGRSSLSFIKWKSEDVAGIAGLEEGNENPGMVMKSYVEYPDLYFTENGEDLPAGPIGIHEHYCHDKTTVGQILVMTEGGAIDINGKTFRKDPVGSIEAVFPGGSYPEGMDHISQAMMMTRVDLVTDQDGHIYTRVKNSNKLFHSGKFLNNQLEYDGEAVSGCSLYMHPFSISPNACVVYDSRRKRMFHVCDSGGSVEWDMQEGDVGAGHSFPILNIQNESAVSSDDGSQSMYISPEDMSAAEKVFTIGYSTGTIFVREYTSTFVVFKRDGRYFLQEMWISRTNFGRGNFEYKVTNARIEEIKGLPGDPDALYVSPYVYNTYPCPYAMLAVGSQLYVYDLRNRTLPVSAYFDKPLRANIISLSGEGNYNMWWTALGLDDGSVIVVNMKDVRYQANKCVVYDSKKMMYNATSGAGVMQETDRTPMELGKIVDVWFKRRGDGIWSVGEF